MPVQPRLRVKHFLKFKYENIVQLAFQKNLYSKTRLDGHITIREKSVLKAKITENTIQRSSTLQSSIPDAKYQLLKIAYAQKATF